MKKVIAGIMLALVLVGLSILLYSSICADPYCGCGSNCSYWYCACEGGKLIERVCIPME